MARGEKKNPLALNGNDFFLQPFDRHGRVRNCFFCKLLLTSWPGHCISALSVCRSRTSPVRNCFNHLNRNYTVRDLLCRKMIYDQRSSKSQDKTATQKKLDEAHHGKYSGGHLIRPCPPLKIQPPKAAPKQRPMPA